MHEGFHTHKKCGFQNDNDNVDDTWRGADCDACDSSNIMMPELSKAYCGQHGDQSHDKCESDYGSS